MQKEKNKTMMEQGAMMDDDIKMMPGGGFMSGDKFIKNMQDGGMMDKEMKMMPGGGHMKEMQDGGMASEKPELSLPQKDGNEGNQPIDEKKKAQVMKMLDGLKEMPPEDQLVGMIAKAVRVSEDEARMIVDEYKASKKMGMGGAMEYEGGGMMKMMRDPKDMVGMTMAGGAKVIS